VGQRSIWNEYRASHVWAIRPGPLCHQSSAAFRAYEELNTSLIVVLIIWDLLLVLGLALTLIAVVGWFLVTDESICLDRRTVWGPPESGVNTDCSGHIDELLRKWGWVS
jgi:hypothetical protein